MKIVNRHLVECVLAVGLTVGVAPGQDQFSNIKSVNVDVFYQAGVKEESARNVADYLERDYDYLRKSIGLDLGRRLEVRVYDTVGKYGAEIRKQRSAPGTMYRRGVLHVQPPDVLEEQKILLQALSSGLAFALLEGAAERGCPGWLVHSFAVYHSGENADLSPPVGMNVSYFSDLDQEIQQYPDPPRRDDVHFLLGNTMRFFVEKFTEKKAFSLFRAFDGKLGQEEVFRNVLELELPVIERQWAAYLESLVVPPRKSSGEKK